MKGKYFILILSLSLFLMLTSCAPPSAPNRLIWSKVFGGSEDDVFFSALPVEDGFLLVGVTNSSDGDLSGFTPKQKDAWILKINEQGDIEKQLVAGGNNDERVIEGIMETDDAYVIYGLTYSDDIEDYEGNGDGLAIRFSKDLELMDITALGDPDTYDILVHASLLQNNYNGYIGALINSLMENAWYTLFFVIEPESGKVATGTYFEEAKYHKFLETPDGGFLFVGAVEQAGEATGTIVKLKSDLTQDWTIEIPGVALSDVVEKDGKYVVAGTKERKEGYAAVISDDGTVVLERFFEGEGDSYISSIDVTEDGNVIFGGTTGWDFWIIKTDENLGKLWEGRYGGSDLEVLKKIVALPNGEALAVGYSRSKEIVKYGKSDGWVLKLNVGGSS